MAEINKIFVEGDISISSVENAVMCFSDGKLLQRDGFALVDGVLELKLDASDTVSINYGYDIGHLYEFRKVLTDYNTIVSGIDSYGYKLTNLTNKNCIMVFVNGILLSQDLFTILDTHRLQIFLNYDSNQINTVQIYVCDTPIYHGVIPIEERGVVVTNDAYDKDRYLFFVNGKKIDFNKIEVIADRRAVTGCLINYQFETSDVLECYVLPNEELSLHFTAFTGYIEYTGTDYYNRKIPVIYSDVVTFNDEASLIIDGIRPGFFIKETRGDGCLMIVGPDFDTLSVNCIKIRRFSSRNYGPEDYYIEVPECRSIVDYLSSFDREYKLLPEILSVLQSLLLREIYDEAIRLKNLRSLTRVDAAYVNKLIRFLGFDMDIKRFPLKKRREVLEELNSYYRVVGTRESYNFFNIIETEFGIIQMDQLFTYHNSNLPNQREYVDFVRMQDTGAYQEHIEYQIPLVDYGRVGINQEIEELDYGMAMDVTLDPDDPEFNSQQREIAQRLVNEYQIEVLSEDYGYVSTPIKGKWVKWYTFNRPKNLYPTNHVDIKLQMKLGMTDSVTLLSEFKNKLYNMASAVLYIHKVSEAYSIGDTIVTPTPGNVSETHRMTCFGFMATPVIPVQVHSISHDIRLVRAMIKSNLPTIRRILDVEDYNYTSDSYNNVKLTKYIGSNQYPTVPTIQEIVV